MIWNLHGGSAASMRASHDAQTAIQKSQRTQENANELEQQMNHLTLASQAMWELVREKTNLTDDDLNEKIIEIDLRDGKRDGKIGHSVMTCRTCGKKVNSRNRLCIMCGTDIEKPHPFEV